MVRASPDGGVLRLINFLRGMLFLLVGTLVAPTVLVNETIYFFNHARGNAFPTHSWFVHEALLTAIGSGVLCSTYLLIVLSTRTRLSTNMQSTT
jgi:hypothetical protein